VEGNLEFSKDLSTYGMFPVFSTLVMEIPKSFRKLKRVGPLVMVLKIEEMECVIHVQKGMG
jgi:hypothetical protein